jgi:putative ABC transport system ATP-binding protein
MIRVQRVSKTFPGHNGHPIQALREIEVDIKQGEFVVVNGASGSGKSTLLFTIGALQQPTSGRVTMADADIYTLTTAERAALRRSQIGFVFQTFNLIPYLNCIENVVFPALLDGRTRQDSLIRAQALLESLGLGARLRHRPGELSVGERQRVAICRSLINEPKVILADEPTGNLDAKRTDEVMAIFHGLHAKGLTVVMATHDAQLTQAGTQVLVLEAGAIQENRKGN